MANTKEFTLDSEEKVSSGAIKLDGGKVPVYRGFIAYFPRAIEEVARVSAFGASKYAWNGWESVDNGVDRYSDAEVRHMLDRAKGEILADDSRLMHLAHKAWNSMAVLELAIREKENHDNSRT